MKFYDTLENNKDKNIDLYVDMDGVIAEYDVDNFDYNTIRPIRSNIKRIEDLSKFENINIKILTVCKTNKIIEEKTYWIEKYMNFFSVDNIIFISKENDDNKGEDSASLKSNYLKKNANCGNLNVVIDDDNSIIKFIRKNNPSVIVFHVSSWID